MKSYLKDEDGIIHINPLSALSVVLKMALLVPINH